METPQQLCLKILWSVDEHMTQNPQSSLGAQEIVAAICLDEPIVGAELGSLGESGMRTKHSQEAGQRFPG